MKYLHIQQTYFYFNKYTQNTVDFHAPEKLKLRIQFAIMKKSLLLISWILLGTALMAQNNKVSGKIMLRKLLELQMPLTAEDENPGRRAGSVAWHPVLRKYYSNMCGNGNFPLAVFDEKGKRISADTSITGVDMRGIWYNPYIKSLQGNGYDTVGLFSMVPKKNGLNVWPNVYRSGLNQPAPQCVGAYYREQDQILYLSGRTIYFYGSASNQEERKLRLNWGRTKADGMEELMDEYEAAESPEGYNITTVIYPGIKGAEIGVLNIADRAIELYDKASGFLTKKLQLPDDAPVEMNFNFSYANGIYWLFSMDERTWYGYKP